MTDFFFIKKAVKSIFKLVDMMISEEQLCKKDEFVAKVATIKEVLFTISILAKFKAKNINELKKISKAIEACATMLFKHC